MASGLVRVTPKEALDVERAVAELATMTGDLVITNDDEAGNAVSLLSRVQRIIKQSEDARTALVKPLNDHVKWINSQFKERTAPLDEVRTRVRRSLGEFERAREAEAAAARKAAEEAAAAEAAEIAAQAERDRVAAMLDGREDEPVSPLPEVLPDYVPPPMRIRGDQGQSVKRKVWKFTVETLLAKGKCSDGGSRMRFIQFDESAIRQFIRDEAKAGRTPAIPGVNIYQEYDISVRS